MKTPCSKLQLSLWSLLAIWGPCGFAESSTGVVTQSTSELSSLPAVGRISTFEKPFQLVDAQDEVLRILPEGIHHLRSITQEMDVIAVVGPFHSGKSYLLNRIMNCERENAFDLGYTVDPTTKGIWMQVAYLSGGSAVAFLDTEGFAASDRTADYDAKIFSISALLSSHLIYNSVRIIDTSAVEYLELLARRARLFQMKTALSESGITAMDPAKPIAFPPLTWVVEDFFQDFREGETPKMWLDRVLDAQPSAGTERTSLRDIFASTDCFPLFLPATSPSALRALDTLEPEELTQEYSDGLELLRAHLTASLKVLQDPLVPMKHQHSGGENGKWHTGTHMADMLELLVDAANNNKMDSIPSLWTLFLERQVMEATDAAKAVFEKELRTVLDVLPPLTETEFAERARQAAVTADGVFAEILFGTASALTANATQTLQVAIDTQTGIFNTENQRRVLEFCQKETRRAEEEFQRKAEMQPLPQSTLKLTSTLRAEAQSLLDHNRNQLKKYGQISTREAGRAETHMNLLLKSRLAQNDEEIEKLLMGAVEACAQLYNKEVEDVLKDGPIDMSTLDAIHSDVKQAAEEAFSTRAAIMKDEKSYLGHESLCFTNVHRRFDRLANENKQLVQEVCTKHMKDAKGVLADMFRQLKLELPMEEQALVQSSTHHVQVALADFDVKTEYFQYFSERQQVRADLEKTSESMRARLDSENVEEWTRRVKEPLKNARRLVKTISEQFMFSASLRAVAFDYALEEIGSRLEKGLKLKVVEKWLDSKPTEGLDGVGDILEAKISNRDVMMAVLSTVLGFLMVFKLFSKRRQDNSQSPTHQVDRKISVRVQGNDAKITWYGTEHPRWGNAVYYRVYWRRNHGPQYEADWKVASSTTASRVISVYRTLLYDDRGGVNVGLRAVYRNGKEDSAWFTTNISPQQLGHVEARQTTLSSPWRDGLQY